MVWYLGAAALLLHLHTWILNLHVTRSFPQLDGLLDHSFLSCCPFQIIHEMKSQLNIETASHYKVTNQAAN